MTPKYKIPLVNPMLKNNELKYVSQAVKSGWISSQGKYVAQFEKKFQRFVSSNYSLAVSSGTTALQLALASIGIKKDDEVIVPNLTFASPVNTIVHSGAKPILCDVDLETYCLNEELIRKKITSKTKAIIIVHLYGYPVFMKNIMKLCKRKNIFIIEDCAEALGSYSKNKHVGTFGDIGTFSFFSNKTVTTGEGGMIIFKNKKFYKEAKILRDHGMSKVKKYWHEKIGYNYRMTNLQAAIGVAQMEKVNILIKKKCKMGNIYKKYLKNLNLIKLPPERKNSKNSYWLYSIRLAGKLINKKEILMKRLEKKGIETRNCFYPINIMPAYKDLKTKDSFKNSKLLSKMTICLPSSCDLNDSQIKNVAKIIKNFVKS